MPDPIPKLCCEAGCNQRIYQGVRCAAHTKDRAHKGLSSKWPYNTQWWRRLRRQIILRDPICKLCNIEASTECDHATPLDQGGSNDPDNLQGVCRPCHTRKTFQENRSQTH